MPLKRKVGSEESCDFPHAKRAKCGDDCDKWELLMTDEETDSHVSRCSGWLSPQDADVLFRDLHELPWHDEVVTVFGREYTVKRRTFSMADADVGGYSYSGKTEIPEPINPKIDLIRKRLEMEVGQQFNFVLFNYYPTGDASIGWHADAEKTIVPGSTIASLSLGATRRFDIRKKDADSATSLKVDLDHGSLLLMEGEMQKHYKHSLPKQTKVKTPRINITFRRNHTTNHM